MTIGKIPLDTLEFLLDLPQEMTIVGLSIVNDVAHVTVETELPIPSEVDFIYQTDEYGNIALTGVN